MGCSARAARSKAGWACKRELLSTVTWKSKQHSISETIDFFFDIPYGSLNFGFLPNKWKVKLLKKTSQDASDDLFQSLSLWSTACCMVRASEQMGGGGQRAHSVKYSFSVVFIQWSTHSVKYSIGKVLIHWSTHSVRCCFSEEFIQGNIHTVKYLFSEVFIR